jgi:HEPN domain-containing protein
MPHDPARVADTKAWLNRAANDLRAAALGLGATPPLLGDVVFHCQQAIEKAMKGLLSWHDEPFRKTHDLEALGETCLRLDSTLESLVDRAAPLTEYAWKFRYPGEDEGPTQDEAEHAMAVAREAFVAILARLPEEVRQGI